MKGYLFIFCEMAVSSMLDSLDRVYLKCLNYYMNILLIISNNYIENVSIQIEIYIYLRYKIIRHNNIKILF